MTAKLRAVASAPSVLPASGPDWRASAGLVARLAVGCVLLFSGLHKAAAPVEEFMVVIEGYGILPQPHIRLFALLIPWLEILGGLFLSAGLWTRAAAAVTGALSTSFFLALLSTQVRGIELANCGCFGAGWHLERWQAMLLDSALLVACAAAGTWGERLLTLDHWVEEGT